MPELRPANPDEGKALPPEVSRSVSALARALVAAARSTVLRDASSGQVFSFVVTPDTLIVDGIVLETLEALAQVGDDQAMQVKLVLDRLGQAREDQPLVNTWEPDGRGDFPRAVVEAVDPDGVQLDPLSYL